MPPQDFSPETISPLEPNNVWLDNGILYLNFNQPFTFEAVQELNGQGNTLRETAGVSYIPTIIIFTNKGKSLDLSLTDLTKASVNASLEHVSTLVIVGLDGASLQLARLANKLTFGGRLIFCNTLEEARTAAEAYKGTNTSILR